MLTEEILKELDILFPDARCELNHKNNYEMTDCCIWMIRNSLFLLCDFCVTVDSYNTDSMI